MLFPSPCDERQPWLLLFLPLLARDISTPSCSLRAAAEPPHTDPVQTNQRQWQSVGCHQAQSFPSACSNQAITCCNHSCCLASKQGFGKIASLRGLFCQSEEMLKRQGLVTWKAPGCTGWCLYHIESCVSRLWPRCSSSYHCQKDVGAL